MDLVAVYRTTTPPSAAPARPPPPAQPAPPRPSTAPEAAAAPPAAPAVPAVPAASAAPADEPPLADTSVAEAAVAAASSATGFAPLGVPLPRGEEEQDQWRRNSEANREAALAQSHVRASSSFDRRRARSRGSSVEGGAVEAAKPMADTRSSSFGRKKDSKLSKISRSLSWGKRQPKAGAAAQDGAGAAGGVGRMDSMEPGEMARMASLARGSTSDGLTPRGSPAKRGLGGPGDMDPDGSVNGGGGGGGATPRSRAIELDGGEVHRTPHTPSRTPGVHPLTRRRTPSHTRYTPLTAHFTFRSLALAPQVIDSSNHANVRTWSFKRAGKRNNKQIEEANAPDGTVKVYFLDGSHKLFDCAAKSVGELLDEVKARLSVAESNAFALYQAQPLAHHLLTPSHTPAHRSTPLAPPLHPPCTPEHAQSTPSTARRLRCSAARTTYSTRTRKSTRSARPSTAAPSRSG